MLMDCNSIVYDAYRELELQFIKQPFEKTTIEHKLIQKTITKIVEYIELVSPTKCAFITFDGVAPFAKMDQQRIRRYKTQYSNQETVPLWNTTAITPGTTFMTHLASAVHTFFKTTYKSPTQNIMISCADEAGEGEHKLFEYLRKTNCKEDVIAVYGLDADLIMLSIFHKQYAKNIYVFREAPTFKTVLSGDYGPKELLFMDIGGLTNSIFQEMGTYHAADKNMRVTDYIFMCFLLGNDFLPHFPALNIRTHGMQILTDTYYQTIGKFRDRSFIHPVHKTIEWKHVFSFMTELAKHEPAYLKKEYSMRAKWDSRRWGSTTPLEKQELLSNLPVIYRTDEMYISPEESGWENRYYSRLLHASPEQIPAICTNYLEGLEWVFHYYTGECPDWRWKYNWSYPPLLTDLVKYIPNKNKHFLVRQPKQPFLPKTQLAYVLPYSQLGLLPPELQQIILSDHSHLYPKEYGFTWAFCRYFWEAHPILPEIPLSLLDRWNAIR
jgi:5'-3' exonuclease